VLGPGAQKRLRTLESGWAAAGGIGVDQAWGRSGRAAVAAGGGGGAGQAQVAAVGG
jgi:hypothetical protein